VAGLVLLVALVARLGVAVGLRDHCFRVDRTGPPAPEVEYLRRGVVDLGDSEQYLLLAQGLLHHGRFAWDSRPNTFRTPGYPFLIALLGGNVTLLVLAQVMLGALTVLIVLLAGKHAFGRRAALAAAALVAFDIASILYAGLVMAETLLVLLLALGLLLVLKRRHGLAGLALGAAALVKPVALLAFLPFAGLLAVRREWRGLGMLLALYTVLPGLWTVRNYIHYRRLGFTSLTGANMLYTYAGALEAELRNITTDSARVVLASDVQTDLGGDNPLELSSRLSRAGVRRIAAHPLRYALIVLRGTGRILAGPKSDDLMVGIVGDGTATATARTISSIATLPAPARTTTWALVGFELTLTGLTLLLAFVALFRRHGRGLRLALLGIGCYFVVMGSPLTDGRLRIPAVPFLALAAASVFTDNRAAGRRASGQDS